MSSINGIGGNNPVQKIVNQPIVRQTPAEPARSGITDKLELSGVGHLLKSDGVRQEKVAAIKGQIEAGTYDEGSKLDVAIDRLMADLDL